MMAAMIASRLLSPIRHAARRLLRARGFSAAAILTMSLGIGAIAAAFSVVHAVLVRPLPYPQSDRLMSLSHTLVVGKPFGVEQSDASLLFYNRHNQTFSAFGGYRVTAAALGPTGGSDAERVPAALVMSGFFPALGVSPVAGRVFNGRDEQIGAPPVVVISEGLWARKFARSGHVPGTSIEVDGIGHEVVGIMPGTLRFPEADTDVWLPLRLNPARTDSATFEYQAIARLREGASSGAARADLQGLLLRLPDEIPGRLTRAAIEQTDMRARIRPLTEDVIGDIGRLLWIVLGAAFFVLAIASANLANLFLVRAEARRTSIAVERALGATAIHIFLQFFCEGLLVSAVATLFGVLIAISAVDLLQSFRNVVDLPRLAEVRVDAEVVAFAGVSAAIAALFASGLPALRVALGSVSSGLMSTMRAGTADRPRYRLRQGLVVAQVAIALVLLVGSGLMARSVWHLRAVRPGFEPARAMTFRLAPASATYKTPEEVVQVYGHLLDGIRGIPGVVHAAAVSKLPLDDQGRTDTAVFVEDRPLPAGALPAIHPVVYASTDYFATAGIPLISGRVFTRRDPPQPVHEVVVSRAFAARYWGDESPVGKRVRILTNGPWYTVVGQVGSVRDAALDRAADEALYCPLLPPREDPRWMPRDLAVIVRTAVDPRTITGAVRDVVRRVDPAMPVYRVRPLTDVVAQASARREVTFLLIGGASMIALTLGAVGLSGVMSCVVALRTREIAIRLALGARPESVRRMMALQGLGAAAVGVALGTGGALILTRTLSTLLYEVSPTDPIVIAAGAVILLLVAAASSWFPTARATSIDPAAALNSK